MRYVDRGEVADRDHDPLRGGLIATGSTLYSHPVVAAPVLVERERELERIAALIDAAAAGAGGVLVIEGPAGIGKTRLLEAGCASAAGRGVRVLTARGSDLERQFAYGVVRQLFEPVLVGLRRGGRAALLGGLAGYAAPVFGATAFAAEGDPAADRSAAVLHGLHWLTRSLAERGPLLIAVDDAHWADLPSLQFVHYLARRVEVLPVALVVAGRRGQPGPESELVRRMAVDAPASVLELRPLSAEATAELVRSLLGVDAADELCRSCHAATGGNPFLVHELTAALRREGRSPGADAAAHVGRLVPDAVARQVLVRLSRLGPTAVRIAHAVAVLAAEAEFRHAGALAGLGESEAADAVDALVSADILAPGLPLGFAHPLLGEAVYQDMRPGERMLAHARAAGLLADAGRPPERVALQLLACEPTGSEWAIATLRAAAREATARGAPQTAARYLERALAEPPGAADRRDLVLELGVAESRAAQPHAAEHLAEAAWLTREPAARARIAQELAGLYSLLGRLGESATVLEEAIDALGDAEDELRFSLEAEAAVLAVASLNVRRRLAPRLAVFRARASALWDVPAAAPLLALIARELADTDGTAEEAIVYAERSFADSRLLSREGPVLVVGASALVTADRPASAEEILNAAISKARARGSIQALRAALVCRAHARNRRGRIAEAEADARLSLELSAGEPSDPMRPFKLAQLVDALIERGEYREADGLLAGAELGRYDHESILFQPFADTHARLLMLRGRLHKALGILDVQLRWQRAWGVRNPGWTSTRSTAALLHHALNQREEARALAAAELEAANAFGAPRAIGIALRTMALVEDRLGIDGLRESVAVLQTSEARLELARTLVELGAALRRAGHRRDAREPLREGHELARACGAQALLETARAELTASGVRVRRPALTGADSLTPSERRIADMAATGATNPQIAQALFVTTKTVEMHLRNTYRKLAITKRTELAATLNGG